MKFRCRLRNALRCSQQGSQADRKEVLQDLQSEMKGKTIIDITTASYLKEEKQWGQTSTTHQNQEALAASAKWVRGWNTVFAVSNLLTCCSIHKLSLAGFWMPCLLQSMLHAQTCYHGLWPSKLCPDASDLHCRVFWKVLHHRIIRTMS